MINGIPIELYILVVWVYSTYGVWYSRSTFERWEMYQRPFELGWGVALGLLMMLIWPLGAFTEWVLLPIGKGLGWLGVRLLIPREIRSNVRL